MVRDWRYTWRPRWCECADTVGVGDRVRLQIHSDAGVKRVSRCTWRPQSREFGDEIGSRDRARLDEYSTAVNGRCAGC